ncbi:unnamed protein product [Fusarium graminearum]|uniref:Chromo domain-containing protein n=1 Tax=Gibberella zeae TaxID=5518 RepID=A0A2H3FPL5_GIBZA|nr:hypothetical protein HG531_005649 [Fusarium graminearum]PCD20796.1 hypothetical protein FGRA07_04948 [Fusarium graminearum]CAF3448048.1 unnamed protein product [Fusarium graminearum]CAF3487928.1 unnamed protein product [Fusarium graminearum]CAF3491207.1 unnamed protein product [Fusarium graminearum]
MPGSTIESFKDAKVRKIVEYAVDLDNREFALIAAVQEIGEDLVLKYWKDIGGRFESTTLGMEQVFKILDDMKQFWTVQWVGYSMKEITEVLKHEIAYKPGFGDVIVKWRRSLTQMELVKVEDFPLGVDYNRRLPAWIGQPPEVECDIDMEAFENGDF